MTNTERQQKFAEEYDALLKKWGVQINLILACGQAKVAKVVDELGQIWAPMMLLNFDSNWRPPEAAEAPPQHNGDKKS